MEMREKVLDYLTSMLNENTEPSKEDVFYRSIEFGKEELVEIERKFKDLEKDLSHLVLFDELFKKSFDAIHGQFPKLHEFLERNYGQDDYDQMLPQQQIDVQKKQNNRFQLLRKIALAYISHK